MTDFERSPAPLTPPDCDLRDFAFMPLDVARLRDSDLAIQVGAEEFRAAVLLWCAAWHQVPAASLPDDDKVLAALAGYGRVVAEWRKHRDGALYGWVQCDDGRLYHPVVAEKAREAWQAKHKHAHDKLVDRVRKANKQREQQQLPPWVVPPLEDWIAAGFPLESELFPAEIAGDANGKSHKRARRSAGNPPENALKGQGQGEEHKKDIAAASLAGAPACEADPVPPPLDGDKTLDEKAMAVAVWLRRKEQARGKQARGTQSNDPRISAWIKAGVTGLQLLEAYLLAVADREDTGDAGPITPGFLDIFVAKMLKPPAATSALNGKRPAPAASDPLGWATTASGIEGRGAELGVQQRPGELFPHFKARVVAAAGLAEEDKARLLADYGVRV
ncbi:DUF1376 domain-containing protein [Bordetella bronchiseptica]